MKDLARGIVSSVLCGFLGYGTIKLAEFIATEEQRFRANPPGAGTTPYISIGFFAPWFNVLGWVMIVCAVIYFGLTLSSRPNGSDS